MALVSVRDIPTGDLSLCRFWDLASTEVTNRTADDPDWTAGALVALVEGEWFVVHVARCRKSPKGVEDFIWATHEVDDQRWPGRLVPVRIELEGGSAGSITIDQFQRGRFVGVDLKGRRPRQSKTERARPWSIAAEAGHVHLCSDTGDWVETFLEELELFPASAHDDQVDAVSGGFHELRPKSRADDWDPRASAVHDEDEQEEWDF